jgi:hypothetical protein
MPTMYVLKCYEPPLRDPFTRRDPEPDPLDRVKVSLHASLEAAQAAGQKSFDDLLGEEIAEDVDERFVLDWGIGGLSAVDDMREAEYEIVVFPDIGKQPATIPTHIDVLLDARDYGARAMFCVDKGTELGEATDHFEAALSDVLDRSREVIERKSREVEQ